MYRKLARGNVTVWIELCVVLIIVSVTAGFAIARLTSPNSTIHPNSNSSTPTLLVNDPIFSDQFADIQGKITKIDGNKATVTSDKGKSEVYAVDDKVLTYPKASPNQSYYPLWGASHLPVGQEVIVRLQMINDQYTVISVSFPPEPPSANPPAPSSAAKK